MIINIHKIWFKKRQDFYNKNLVNRLYSCGYNIFLYIFIPLLVIQKLMSNNIANYILAISIFFFILGFLTELYILGKSIYDKLIFKWFFTLSFSVLVVISNILAKKDIYEITGFNLIDLTEAKLLLAIINIPLLIVICLIFIAIFISIISIVGMTLIDFFTHLNQYRLSRIIIGSKQIGYLLEITKNLRVNSDNSFLASIICIVVFTMFIMSPTSYKQIILKDLKTEIIVWSSFYNGNDCKNLESVQGYLPYKDKTIILTYSDEGASFDIGTCQRN